ncbi:MAG: ABC transporter permease subunit [Phycisphaerae bacterium]
MNQILSKLGLWFWYLLPANPILVRVVAGASRRTRHLWLRTAYLAALLAVVLISLLFSMSRESSSLAELAKGASTTFMLASTVQLALMCFLAPIFTASAITQERDAQTFNILLSTPLTNAQIVFGSLMSRLYFVLMLLLAGLPIFLMTMVYGGVTASQVIESFALSGATAVLTGALAIFIAMTGVGTRRTIFSFYLAIVLYLLSVYLLGEWDRTWVAHSPENIAGRKMSWLTALHPFLALDVALNRVYAPPYAQLSDHGPWARYALAYPSTVYVMWTTLLAFLLTLASVLFVRRGSKTGEATFLGNLIGRFRGGAAGDRTRPPRSVWNNPVAWREAKTRMAGGGLLRWLIIALGFLGPTYLYYVYLVESWAAAAVPKWLSGMLIIQFALALIVATNMAATSITKEKESKSMELLLTTPLTSKYILWGKLRGLISFAAPLLIGPVLALLVFGVHSIGKPTGQSVVRIETVVEVAVLLVVYTAFACVVGLWRSLNSKTNVSAVMHSLGLMILIFGVATLIGFAIVDSSIGEFGAFLAAFTPFTSIRYIVDLEALFPNPKDFAAGAGQARLAAWLGCLVAAGLYAFIVWRLYAGLVRTFDMTLRKQSAD